LKFVHHEGESMNQKDIEELAKDIRAYIEEFIDLSDFKLLYRHTAFVCPSMGIFGSTKTRRREFTMYR